MLTLTAAFTKTVGVPATGLTLSEIDLYLTAIAKATGAQTVIWDGTQHPTAEIADLGMYLRQYATEDLITYEYVGGAHYAGAEVLDSDWITGAISLVGGGGITGTGTYTDTITDGVNPLDGVRVQLSTDNAGSNRVYEAFTNASGVFSMNPDPGTYYRWLDLAGYTFTQGVQVIVV